ncbi:uncharacterized protein DS421_8g252330 [Arachis hypogaea]|nr:uncharacterized protein DS421_8g252330 [Arachis hypogaea]
MVKIDTWLVIDNTIGRIHSRQNLVELKVTLILKCHNFLLGYTVQRNHAFCFLKQSWV